MEKGCPCISHQVGESVLKVKKLIPEAVVPSRAHPDDTGYDLTLIRVINQNFGPGVVLYGTGISVAPPKGTYIDLIGRSSLCKQGWFIANSIGVIDCGYRGELCVPMAKISPQAPDLKLPARVAQIVVRTLITPDVEVVDSLDETERGGGGFGSSNPSPSPSSSVNQSN